VTGRVTEAEARATLYAAPLGDVPQLSALHAFLLRLLSQHPRHAEKAGAGVASFRVVTGAYGRNRAVLLRRVDGSEDLFSWLKCCNGARDQQDVRAAYREAVDDQVRPLRRPGMHVDHAEPWPFDAIVRAFGAGHGAITRAGVVACDAPPWRHRLADERRRELFAAFHRERSVLVAIPAADNLRKPRGRGARR
jgi:hypothetical protein